MLLRRILYATDYSEASARALTPALELARHFHAELDVLHVTERLVDIVPVIAGTPPGLTAAESEINRAAVEHLTQWLEPRIPQDVPVNKWVEEGDPADNIVRVASERAADLIVMGTHGHSAVERFFLGSVTEAVLRKTHVPVLAIPGASKNG